MGHIDPRVGLVTYLSLSVLNLLILLERQYIDLGLNSDNVQLALCESLLLWKFFLPWNRSDVHN